MKPSNSNQHEVHHNVVEIKNLSFSYGRVPVLSNISLNIHRGDYLCLIGPNGGGKTTLLKLILGLLKPESGTISKNSDLRIGYVPQSALRFDQQFPATVSEVVRMGLGTATETTSKADASVNSALAHVGMNEFSSRRIGDLSGGQQQRVFIARALVAAPNILFLDEPTAGTDVELQQSFYELLDDLHEKLKITLVLISHELNVISKKATEFACINKTLTYHGTPASFMASSQKSDASKTFVHGFGGGLQIIPHSHV
jgi:zinc transport system ATP-binding protein